ncbi:hypothetical protein KEM55_002460 [Ascosphaera atra]|nr:hypothetical protein KEM55_002460 [Ascosphaera atra]
MEIIIALLDLGVDDNPVWVWLLGRYDFLKTKITVFCDRSKVEIEILRRQLLTAEKPTPHKTAPFLRLQNRDGTRSPNERLDRDPVVHWWETVNNYLKKLLSLENGVLGEVLDFWGTIQSFINGEKQKMLPAGFDGESSKHHNLSEENIRELKHGVIELLDLVRTNVYGLFVDAPIEDVSSLVTPSTPIPLQQLASTESQFRPDLKDMPSSTLKAGEFWDDFAFWPPYATSLSGVHYLCQYMALIGTAATEMAASNLVGRGGFFEKLKILISATRERCIRAICAAWNKDAEICKYLEDWERDPERRNVTRMPGVFTSFERCILTGLQKVMFVSEAKGKSRGLEVISAPPSKLLQMVRTQLVTSVYKVLSGMVENAEHPVQPEGQNEWILTGSTTSAVSRENVPSLLIQAGGIDSSNRNVRMLLTLSNLRALRSDYVPLLIANFESFFTVKLTDESNTIFDVLGQIDSRLFQSYTQPTATRLDAEIRKGVTADEWNPPTSRPTEVRPYVFAVMLQLVMVHTEVSTTLPIPWSETNSPGQGSLTYAVLSHLLVRISSSLLAAFTIRQRYSIAALMQATLDTEFIAQTLSQYSSEEASKLQSQIYLELDRRTDSEARNRLQTELGEMRNVLKKLREGTKGEFACFRKVRTQPRGSVA